LRERPETEQQTAEQAFLAGSAGRHETFTPRYGWLKKGYDRCVANPHVFNDDNAIEQLGVGKNMVRSIRFWCVLFRLLEDAGMPGCMHPTTLGERLLRTDTGWDPYLEDPASLWLLHWQVFAPPFAAVSWNVAFSFTTLTSFRPRELADSVIAEAQRFEGLRSIASGSFEKDASCIVRMYGTGAGEQVHTRSPFSDLGLIVPAREDDAADHFRFALGPKSTLPDLVLMAAVFDFARYWLHGQRSVSLAQVTFEPNSPGMAFRLSESDCGQRLDRACRSIEGVVFTETNGIRQVQFDRDPGDLSWECLNRYYEVKE
jgi:hypothetical protein